MKVAENGTRREKYEGENGKSGNGDECEATMVKFQMVRR